MSRLINAYALVSSLMVGLMAPGCGDLTNSDGVNDPCADIATAISYRSFTCAGDGDAANALHDSFLSVYTCDEVTSTGTGAHFDCVGRITEASCEQVEAAGDNFEAWLALGETCETQVSTAGQTGCTAAISQTIEVLAQRGRVCQARDPFVRVLTASMREGVACDETLSPDERGPVLMSCLSQLGQTCRNEASADAWLRSASTCDQVFERVSSTPDQICAEVSEAIFEGVLRNTSLCNGLNPEEVRIAFNLNFSCTGDLSVPTDLNSHLACLEGIINQSCAALPADALADPATWLSNVACPLVQPR